MEQQWPTVRDWYVFLLGLFDEALRKMVDLYNMDLVSDKCKQAMEIIDGLSLED